MGKSQSKLSSEELQELQKNTYCEFRPACPPTGVKGAWTAGLLRGREAYTAVDKKELQQWVGLPAAPIR